MKRCILAFVFAGLLPAFAEKSNVFFIHGANVSEQDARFWADQMFKRLWQAGAQMEFMPIAWESDIGPSWNYHENVSNAFVMAARIAPLINAEPGRNVIIAHSLGTVVAAAAIVRPAVHDFPGIPVRSSRRQNHPLVCMV